MVGALLFMVIEGGEKKGAHSELTIDDIKRNFVSSYNVSESDFEIFLYAVRNSTYFQHRYAKIPWSFGNSLYFAVILITTIGRETTACQLYTNLHKYHNASLYTLIALFNFILLNSIEKKKKKKAQNK